MPEIAALSERLAAYRKILREDPSLSGDERERLFTMAVFPEAIEVTTPLTYEHMMVCRDKHCRVCSEGQLAA